MEEEGKKKTLTNQKKNLGERHYVAMRASFCVALAYITFAFGAIMIVAVATTLQPPIASAFVANKLVGMSSRSTRHSLSLLLLSSSPISTSLSTHRRRQHHHDCLRHSTSTTSTLSKPLSNHPQYKLALPMNLIAVDEDGGNQAGKDGKSTNNALFQELTMPSSLISFKESSSFSFSDDTNGSNNEVKNVQKDRNGTPISIGDNVRIAKDELKAYQVGKKGYGRFDDATKQFIPATEEEMSVRSGRSLQLPIGLQGQVTTIIDKSDGLSANFPVVVKFLHRDASDDGDDISEYNPPATFTMHLGPKEIEVV